ncbi:putative HVA22-like protein g [Drosophila subobscura]|uniref:putative HVA22-like protein g n=1 Tax=Drosophila subobscura TaxID=7241 RepID=UPI00155B1749|nr:putative HVA22-like protein g [Drosophila subobscura]
MCLFSCVARVLFYTSGTILPAYHTFKALFNGMEKEIAPWAKYWIVYAFLATFEVLADMLLSWVPLYAITKMAMIICVVFTAPAASVWIFNSILGPLLFKRQKQIDHFLQRGKQQLLNDVFSWGTQFIIQGRAAVLPVFFRMLKHDSIEKRKESNVADGLEEYELSDNCCKDKESIPNIHPDAETVAERLALSAAMTHIAMAHSPKNSSCDLDLKTVLPSESSGTFLNRCDRKRWSSSLCFSNAKNEANMGETEDGPPMALPIQKDEVIDETENLLAKSRKEGNGRTFCQFINRRGNKL